MEKDLAQFVGKVVSLKNDEKLAYIVEITPYLVCVGQNDEESYQEFNENYEFIDEELQKSWDDFYIQYKAKKLLSSEDDSNEDEDEEWGIKDSFKKKIKEKTDLSPSVFLFSLPKLFSFKIQNVPKIHPGEACGALTAP